jgi:rhamnosyltransferase
MRKKNKFAIASVVVLYNPDDRVYDNILSFSSGVEVIYIVDNSDKKDCFNVKKLKKISEKIRYIKNEENFGIAYALNQGADLAVNDGYLWLLTLDQDSRVKPDMINNLLDYLKSNDTSKIGIISSFHEVKFSKKLPIGEYEHVLETMTSGNILNLEVFKIMGHFINELFIDSVDHEYCLRLNKNGFKVIIVNSARLVHPLGDRKSGRFLRIRNLFKMNSPLMIWRTYNNHNYIRKYYIVRNRFYVSKMYKKEFPEYRKKMIRTVFDEVINVIMFEHDKFTKLKSMLIGYIDYKRGFLGKKKFN